MSHFVVAVMTKKHPEDANFEQILEKYDENKEVERYIKLTKEQVVAKRKKEVEDYKNGLYARYLKDPEKYKETCGNPSHLEYISNTFPNVVMKMNDEELYQDYIKNYPTKDEIEYESEEYLDEDGNITSTYNPYSKWDWWVIGGRWSNDLPLKTGESADYAKVSDVAWGYDIDISNYIEENPDIKERYDKLLKEGDGWYRAEYFSELYPTLEDYVKHHVRWIPFAIITPDGEWHEKGEMGWFGMSTDTPEDSRDWNETFYDKFVKDNLDCYVTLIDCHI